MEGQVPELDGETEASGMKASVGDRIITASGVVGGAVRDGIVVDCPHDDGSPPYQVRWSDTGEESLVYPGPDSLVQHDDGDAAEDDEVRTARAVTWTIQVSLVEASGSTTAEAVLVVGPGEHSDVPLRSVGHARKDPHDTEIPVIGDEVAAGRALRRLADALLGQAEEDITASTGVPAHVHD
ncbi:dsRBD fold-containing protein [Isoptericola sp. AK164]|uniref:dsRBD fold-containing protein n=1 Tax=Isoptericola sp. AK164 TaxID=3024246 RepID=UPI00241889E0|nr:dsRBD fold-containing protein [Isoptericola sp. AK164]